MLTIIHIRKIIKVCSIVASGEVFWNLCYILITLLNVISIYSNKDIIVDTINRKKLICKNI